MTTTPMRAKPVRRSLLGLGLVLAAGVAAQSPDDLATALRTGATGDLVDAVERHETVFWGAERAAKLQGLGRSESPFTEALARAVFVTYHEVDHAALLDPARRGSDPAFDREALLVLDLIHGWLATLSSRVVLEGARDPTEIPLPDHEVVLRFLERARLPAGDDFVRHARLVGLRFLDRVGHSELVLGRPVFFDLPLLAEEWARYEGGERDPPEPDRGLPGEPIGQVAAIAQEYLDRTSAVASAFASLGDARHSGFAEAPLLDASYPLPASLVRLAIPPAPLPPAPPPKAPARPSGPGLLNWILLGGIVLVALRLVADLVRPAAAAPEVVDVAGAGEDVAQAATVVAPAESFDEIREEADAFSGAGVPTAAPGAELPTWLQAALEQPLGGRYRDLEVLGSGGMGTVVAAHDTRLDRKVAIKVPPPHLAGQPEFRERFLREARALARLDHPGVVRIHDVPDVGAADVPVLIMEFLEGEDLMARVERAGFGPSTETCQWMVQAAAGLDHAHAQGVLHRDVKPANLVLTIKKRVKLLDFGLASTQGQERLTLDGAAVGSLPYMPPEQLAGNPVDHLADQYALGVTAYFLLSHRLPFEKGDGIRTRPREAAGRGDGLDPRVDAVFTKVLHPDATQRYGSCAEFARALLKASQGL